MKRFSAKYSRPALTVMLALVLTMVMAAGTAFAMVEISNDFYITDEADVISDATEEYIISQNGYLEANCSGAQIAVVTVDFLDGMDIEDYCYKLFDQMNLGASGENNGILLLLTIGEENYWCMQGKGLERELTAGEIDEILWHELEPDFAVGDYDAGVRTVFDALAEEVCMIYGAVIPGDESGSSDDYYDGMDYIEDMTMTMFVWFIFIIFLLILMFVILFVITMIKKSLRRSSGQTYYDAGPVVHRTPRRRSRPIIIVNHGRPQHRPPRPPRPSSGGFGGGFGSGRPSAPSRPTSRPSRPSSRPNRPTSRPSSFGGGGRVSRPSGRGGGGMSRGGGAGRRGR